MKNQIAFLIILFFTTNLYSQNYQISWQQCFGGTEQDNALDIVETEGGYLIIGWTESEDGDISYNHGLSDGWIIKTDFEGDIIWEKTYGGTKGDNFRRIFKLNENEYYILGASNSSDGDISNDPYTDSWDFWILKIDGDGNILWDKIIGGNADEVLWSGSLASDGGILAIGWTYSNDGDISVNYGGADTWMVKLSSEGELEWDFTIGTDFIDKGSSIIQTSDGGYLVGSYSIKGESGNITCDPISIGYFDGVLFKLDTELNIEWQNCYGSSNHDAMWELMELENGYLFSEGVTANDGDVSGWHGEGDIWMVKIDFFGNIVWQRCLGGSLFESALKTFKTNDYFTIIGSTQSNDGDVSGNHSTSEYDHDIWLVKLNNEGELLSQQCFGGERNEIVHFGVIEKSSNNFVIAGLTDYGPSYDVACTPHGGNNDDEFWVFEIQDTTTNIINQNQKESNIIVYPNPTQDYVIFEIKDFDANSTIKIVNIFGEEIKNITIKAEKTVWDCRKTQSGVYFYSFTINGLLKSGKILISR